MATIAPLSHRRFGFGFGFAIRYPLSAIRYRKNSC